jgi:hypothetical protein
VAVSFVLVRGFLVVVVVVVVEGRGLRRRSTPKSPMAWAASGLLRGKRRPGLGLVRRPAREMVGLVLLQLRLLTQSWQPL